MSTKENIYDPAAFAFVTQIQILMRASKMVEASDLAK